MTSITGLVYYGENGLITADFPVIKQYLQSQMRTIFGEDINIEDGTPDGILINLLAEIIYDMSNQLTVIYNSLSREGAVGVQLDNFASLNNISRKAPTKSTAKVALGGVEGTRIVNGLVKDVNNYIWSLEPLVTIKPDTLYQVTCNQSGNIFAGANEINKIVTQVAGWTDVTNPDPSNRGNDQETDAQLRYRIKTSYDATSVTVLNGLKTSLQNLDNVNNVIVYENDSDIPTSMKGGTELNAHSVAVVIDGGDESQIAQTMFNKKTPGIPYQGDTSIELPTEFGTQTIRFYKSTLKNIYVKVVIKAKDSYIDSDKDLIKENLAKLLVKTYIADTIYNSDLINQLLNSFDTPTFNVVSLKLGTSLEQATNDTLDLNFREISYSEISFIEVEVQE